MELNVATPVQSGYHLAWQRPTADPAHQPPRSRCYSTKRSPHSRLVSLDNGHADAPANALRLFRHLVGPGNGRRRRQDSQTASGRFREPCDFTGQLVRRFGFYVAKESRGDALVSDQIRTDRCSSKAEVPCGLTGTHGDRIIELEGDPGQSRLGLADIRGRDWLTGGVCGFELFAVETNSFLGVLHY
uniref:Uncharacterized protein n=1 Tax=Macrostomum lignano TaxID=282301 RepID=A0A1I8JQ86_9PLAT